MADDVPATAHVSLRECGIWTHFTDFRKLFRAIADNHEVGIGDREDGRSRRVASDQAAQDEHDDVDRAQHNRMRLLGMRRRQVQRKAARQAEGNAKIPESGGSPLATTVRARMEPELGADLSSVRVHTSGESATAADKLGARAFTTGSDVHFGAGEYAPGTKEGDRLIAHELTHAVQAQKSGIQRKASGDVEHHDADGGAHDVSQPGEPAEQEADAVADGVADKLHGGDGKKQPAAAAGKEAAPAIGAKLSGRKIFRAGKDPLKSSTKNALGTGPEVSGMRVGNAQQAGAGRTPHHHVFPQEQRAWFKARNFDIDQYCVEQSEGEHSALHTMKWNIAIMRELEQTEKALKRKLKPDEILAAGKKVMGEFGIGNLPFVPFKGEGKK